jgi:hypothetical protein
MFLTKKKKNKMSELDALQKALEAGSYNADSGNLIGGAALQVEDLSVVLRLVTFTCVISTDNKKLARLLRNLDQRHIPYRLTSIKLKKRQLITFSWNKKLKVGKRTFLYRTER